LIAGLEVATSGTISVGGKEVTGVAPKQRDVAMVFQSPALYPHMTVYENLAFGLKLRKFARSEIDRRVRESAEMLGLTARLESRPKELSGGQRQRVAIGRAIARRASVLLLDEPLANVDPPLRAQMRSEIAGLCRQFGTTTIYVTHDHVEALMVGDRLAVLREGVLQQIAQPAAIYREPANLFVARFVGSPPMNFFQGVLVRRGGEFAVDVPDSTKAALSFRMAVVPRLEESLNKSVVLGLRPEHITCANGKPEDATSDLVRARIGSIQTVGPDTYLHACAAGNSFVARISSVLRMRCEQEYEFNFDTRRACLFDPATSKTIFCPCES
jgi:multiple sugar transport system ATP-binding protein